MIIDRYNKLLTRLLRIILSLFTFGLNQEYTGLFLSRVSNIVFILLDLIFLLENFGLFREKIVVPNDKPFITLSGTENSNTIITWKDGGSIFDSPTLSVLASDFVARYLTIQVSIIC